MMKVINGPVYLKQPPSRWPEQLKNISVDRADVELKIFHVHNAKVLTMSISTTEPLIEPTKFSSWSRLVMEYSQNIVTEGCAKEQMVEKIYQEN